MCRELGCILYNCILTVIIMSTNSCTDQAPSTKTQIVLLSVEESFHKEKFSYFSQYTTNKLKHAHKIDWKYKP